MMLTFLQPERLAWALVAGAIVLMYLRSLVPRAVETPHLGLWHKALARRSVWTVWQRGVSLALQLALVFCLALALGEPVLTSGRPEPRLVLVVDSTASMRAPLGNATRLEAARQAAARRLEETDPRVPAALVVFGATVELRAPLGTPRDALHKALQAIEATDGAASRGEALELARAISGPSEPVLFSDGGDATTSGQPASPPNLAVTRLAARPAADEPERYQVLVEVGNFRDAASRAIVELHWPGDPRPVARQTLDLPPGGVDSFVATIDGRAAGLLTARLADHRDALPADDVAQVRLPPLRATKVVLVGPLPSTGPTPLAARLRAAPRIAFATVDALPAQPETDTVYVLAGSMPAKLPPRSLIVDPAGDGELFRVGALREGVWSLTTAGASPLLEPLAWGDVLVEQARPLEFTAPADVLVAARDANGARTPILATLATPDRRAVVVGLDLATSDLLLRRGVDEFFSRACEWLVERSLAERSAETTSATLAIAPAAAARTLVLPATPPATSPLRLPVPAAAVAVGPLPRVGVWRLAAASGQVDARDPALAVSLVNAEESSLPAPAAENSPPPEPASLPLWPWPAALAALLLLVEWLLFHHRITI